MKDIFLEKIKTHQNQLQTLKKKSKSIALARGIIAILGILCITYFANERETFLLLMSFGISLLFFIPLVFLHKKVRYQASIHEISIRIYEKEIQKLDGNFNALDGGNEFIQRDHPYTSDLDIFGQYSSLFQLINHTVTQKGRMLLAKWMQKKADTPQIIERQEIVKELAEKETWRVQFEAVSHHFYAHEKINEEKLLHWNTENFQLPKVYRVITWISGITAINIIVMWLMGFSPISFLFLTILCNVFLIYKFSTACSAITKNLESQLSLLATYKALFQLIIEENFTHPTLEKAKRQLLEENALQGIESLSKVAYRFQSRSNIFYWIFNILFAIDIHNLHSANKWMAQYQGKVQYWLAIIAEFEALNSLAAFTYANPKFIFPTISSENYTFESVNLGHPLIAAHKRVYNDFNFNNAGQLALITGSNMSGKSTFLRTCGINMVLSFMGAPVCAEQLKISPTRIFTSMRTEDNLEESVSAFYAELKRIQMLLEAVERDQEAEPLIFMLDELLKGTNSEDRHAGAAALIKQLRTSGVSGFISTHDLGLGRMEDDTFIQNYSFTSTLNENELIFDYKIKQGMCENFNALRLMKKIGIRI